MSSLWYSDVIMSCDHNNDIPTRLISHVISDYCISKQKY